MKKLIFTCFLAICFIAIYGQKNDSIKYCILKYKFLTFVNPGYDSKVNKITLFMYPNGNFFHCYGHVNSPTNEEYVSHSYFNNGKLTKKCLEKYISFNNDSLNSNIINYFPSRYYKSGSKYLKSIIEEYSILLQGFKENLLFNSVKNNVFRLVFPCYEYSDGMFKEQPHQYYNLIRVHFYDSNNMLVYKRGYFNKKLNFVIDYEKKCKLDHKKTKQLLSLVNKIKFSDIDIYYRNSFGMQRLFEFYYKGQYNMVLRAESYESRVEDVSYFNGLYNRLFFVIKNKIAGHIEECDK